MCISKPKAPEPVAAPPRVSELDAAQNVVARRQSDIRRRQRALSRASTMTGSMAADASGKTKLGA